MKKRQIQYDTPLDALVAIVKQLHAYEMQYRMDSEDFNDKFQKGQLDDSIDFIEWANAYEHYIALRAEVQQLLVDVA